MTNCDQICYSEVCKKLIAEQCPPVFYVPSIPIVFGHIYFAYTKEYIVRQRRYTDEPEYICYNAQLCGGFYHNRTTLWFNKTTCRRPQDFPLYFTYNSPNGRWVNNYVTSIYDQLSQCNTILPNNSECCNGSIMYQCINSTKCISKIRLLDNIIDCDYGDDELQISIDGGCPKDFAQTHFNCTNQKKYISRKLLEDGRCQCGYDIYDTCIDENLNIKYKREHIINCLSW